MDLLGCSRNPRKGFLPPPPVKRNLLPVDARTARKATLFFWAGAKGDFTPLSFLFKCITHKVFPLGRRIWLHWAYFFGKMIQLFRYALGLTSLRGYGTISPFLGVAFAGISADF